MPTRLLCLAAGAVLALLPCAAPAQDSALGTLSRKPEHVADSNLGFRKGSIVVAPIPISNPTIGSGLILGGGYMFKADEGSDTSFFGLAAMRTDNGSQAAGAGISLHFNDNRWNLQLLGGAAQVFYDLYGYAPDRLGPLPIDQEGAFARVKLAYGITRTLSAGIEAAYLDTRITSPDVQKLLDPVLPDLGVQIRQATYGPVLSFSNVDDSIYPTRGIGLTYTGQRGQGLEGFHRTFWKNVTIGTGYLPLGERVVLAGKLTGCTVTDGAPFYNLCIIGGTDGFRGYSVGEYLGHALGSAQGAVRFTFGNRLGGAVFAGIGSVAPDSSALADAERLYAGGVGVRLRISRKFPLDFAVDVAVNADDETTTYVRVGQAF